MRSEYDGLQYILRTADCNALCVIFAGFSCLKHMTAERQSDRAREFVPEETAIRRCME